MIHWIVMVYLISGGHFGTGMIPYKTQAECRAAITDVMRDFNRDKVNQYHIIFTCRKVEEKEKRHDDI